jgi:SAM domain (Sterile alpha motif)
MVFRLDDHDCHAKFGRCHAPRRLAADLGLGKYEPAFRENEIDETVLPSLTHENTALGHRLKLLDAIATLRNDASVQAPPVAAAPARPCAPTPTAAPVAEPVGERRHVTVMFCDLVGSTSISAALDAEDWVGSYLDAATAPRFP